MHYGMLDLKHSCPLRSLKNQVHRERRQVARLLLPGSLFQRPLQGANLYQLRVVLF